MNQIPIPSSITSQQVDNINGLCMHVLTAGKPENPCIMLLHGFPDLAYGWRHIMGPLADQGYYVVAPDQRGYGKTTGWDARFETDIRQYNMLNLSKDIIALLYAMQIKQLHCLVGHDFGSPVAAYIALLRSDLVSRLVCMSAPFPGAPKINAKSNLGSVDLDVGLKDLIPPRKHYQAYYSTPEANGDMLDCRQGMHQFLRAYYHVKSADWEQNQPKPLSAWSAQELAKMPHYYVMPLEHTMPEVVASDFPQNDCAWLTDDELEVYVTEFNRTQFQGALNWYRCSSDGEYRAELSVFCGKKLSMPTWYIAGREDWGTHQTPGALKRMQQTACDDFRAVIEIPNAGHWVQQEQVAVTSRELLQVCSTD